MWLNASEQPHPYRLGYRDLSVLAVLAATAVGIHGYHLGIEDQAIYLPAILKHLDPSLFPHDAYFFEAQTRPMLLDDVVAWFVRLTHVSVDWTLFAFHLLTIFLLLVGCYRILRRCFGSMQGTWAGVGMITGLLTLPIAGTAQYIVDQYLHPRAVATALVLIPVADLLPVPARLRGTRAFSWCALFFLLAAIFHFQMALFGAALWIFLVLPWERWIPAIRRAPLAAAAIPILGRLLAPGSPAWLEATRTRSQHYLLHWEWYELLGIIAPMILLWGFGRIAARKGLSVLAWLSRRIASFGTVALILSAALILPPRFERLTPYQPMRVFILIYIFLLLIGGGLLGQFVLRRVAWRWALLFIPMSLGMFLAERALFPASPHIELPGYVFHNDWTDAFLWVRSHTPKDAYFALPPHYLSEDGEDFHGFRAWAERGQMADLDKDPGVVSLFPSLAPEWQRQVHALQDWNQFTAKDFARIQREFGVDWVVLEARDPAGKQRSAPENLECPYQNASLYVCKIR